ncbi:MAG TPA: hypothetical protein VNZ58_13585 [Thermomicrobiales bacterium]|nr:hypothetical protein [Thermomicrobiales bacterium]
MLDRRTMLRAAGTGTSLSFLAGLTPRKISAQQATPDQAHGESRQLITRTVAYELSQTHPLHVLTDLEHTPVTNGLLIGANGGSAPDVSTWNDWNDRDLRDVFGAVLIGDIGTIRIFDTTDIAYQRINEQLYVEGAGVDGYYDIAGMRADRIVADEYEIAHLRLAYVSISALVIDNRTDVALGIVRHLHDVLKLPGQFV